MIEHIHPEGEPTPTIAELYEMKEGLAEVAKWTEGTKTEPPRPSIYRLTDKGNAYLGAIMKRNAEGTLARGTANAEAVDRLVRVRGERPKTNKKGSGRSGNKGTWSPS